MVRRSFLLALVTAATVALLPAAPAIAGGSGPEKAFAGKIMISDKRFPTTAKSPGAYTSAVKKQAKTKLQEDKAKQSWRVYFAAFLKKAPADVEVQVRVLDASTRPATLLTSFDQYLDTREQRSIVSSFTLTRAVVGVNKTLTIQIESAGVVLATGRVDVLGEAVKYTGKVDFSEGDTK